MSSVFGEHEQRDLPSFLLLQHYPGATSFPSQVLPLFLLSRCYLLSYLGATSFLTQVLPPFLLLQHYPGATLCHVEPSLNALSLGSDVISSMKVLSCMPVRCLSKSIFERFLQSMCRTWSEIVESCFDEPRMFLGD